MMQTITDADRFTNVPIFNSIALVIGLAMVLLKQDQVEDWFHAKTRRASILLDSCNRLAPVSHTVSKAVKSAAARAR